MSPTSTDRLPIVEEVVATLTSAAGAGYGGSAALRAGMRRATDQFDMHAASALARSLVDCLCKSPDDVRVLETLVILGLAHPGALAEHRISLISEGRRLAYLLEKSGQYERAYCLGELIAERAPPEATGANPEDTAAVEQLVRDAEFAAARGRTESAIRCLEEAQKIDPARADLPRAIRDLRRKKEFRAAGAKHSLKLVALLIVGSGALTAVILREARIWSAWKALPETSHEDAAAMRTRLAGVEALLEKERAWITMPLAIVDRDLLRHDIELQERPVLPVETDIPGAQEALLRGTPYDQAEDARLSGLRHAEKGRVVEAIAELRKALEVAPPDWRQRAKVQANIAALEAWQKKESGRSP